MKTIYFLILSLALENVAGFGQNGFIIDTTIVYLPAISAQSHPSVASGGSKFLGVWYDFRCCLQYHSEHVAYLHIFGSRIDNNAQILDTAGFPISYCVIEAGYYPPCQPGIAYGNGIFLISWRDARDDLSGDIFAARVDTNGVVLDHDGFVVSSAPATWQDAPSIAFDGSNFLVAWYDQRIPSGSIYGCRISQAGEILDTNGILIAAPGQFPFVSTAFDGRNYLVVWGGTDIYGARVDTAGNVMDTIAICTSAGDQYSPTVTHGNEHYFIAWETRIGPNSDIYGARLDTTGVLLDTNGIAIATTAESEGHPAVAFDGTNYLVTWNDYAAVYCARVNSNGVVLDPGGIIVCQDTTYEDHSPTVSYNGADYLIAWYSGQLSHNEIYCTRVETSGVVIDTSEILLSMAAYPGRSSAAGFDGAKYFVVWADYRDSLTAHVYGSRVDTAGTILDPSGIFLFKGTNPAVAFDGSNYLTVCSGIKAARIDTTGMLLDTFTVFPNGGDYPAVIFDGTRYFTTWHYAYDIYGARIDTLGTVLDTNGIIISNGPYEEGYPSVAFDGTNYMVAWHYGSHETTFDIYCARIDTMGCLIDTVAIPIATGPYRHWYPSIAFDGTNYFVVWEDRRNGYADIYGARVTSDGIVLDTSGLPLCTALSGQYAPQITFDDTNFIIIWEDWRNGDSTDIYGCHVNPLGSVIDEFIVTSQANNQIEPAITKGSNKFLITFSSFTDSINSRATNTMRIWGLFYSTLGVKEDIKNHVSSENHSIQIYPNPTRKHNYIKYCLSQETYVKISLYDIAGKLIKEFINEKQHAGSHKTMLEMDGLSQGVYFLKFKTREYSVIAKIVFIK